MRSFRMRQKRGGGESCGLCVSGFTVARDRPTRFSSLPSSARRPRSGVSKPPLRLSKSYEKDAVHISRLCARGAYLAVAGVRRRGQRSSEADRRQQRADTAARRRDSQIPDTARRDDQAEKYAAEHHQPADPAEQAADRKDKRHEKPETHDPAS